MSALKIISSVSYLKARFEEMFQGASVSKRDTAGVDRLSLNDFYQDLDKRLRNLSKSLRSGSYESQELSPYFVPKPSGGHRVICVPSVKDRLVQRCILHYLNEKGYTLDNGVSYGFVRGSGVHKAASKAVECREKFDWVYKADISAFFDRIDRDILKEVVNTKIKARSLRQLICLSIDIEIKISSSSEAKKIKKLGIKEGMGLRQGMPVSPYLANLYLEAFDRSMVDAGIPMVRYADDIVAFASSREECISLHDHCRKSLSLVGLSLHDISEQNETKTSISNPEEMVEFLGLGLVKYRDGYQLIVTDQQLTTIKQSLFELSKMDYCFKHGITISKLLSRLDSKIRGYQAAYDCCANKPQLADSLRDWREEVVRRVFVDNFGIEPSQLTKNQRSFLEIG